MSMHKIPLTQLEEDGLRAHGLDIGSPSQLSDVFRHGIKWALEQTAPQPENSGLTPEGYADYAALEAECKRLSSAHNDASYYASLYEELRAAQTEQQPIGWITEDYLTDKSATTYSPEVADRWRAKGWPVSEIYATPITQAEPTDTFTAVDMATAAAQGFRDGQTAVEPAPAQDERERVAAALRACDWSGTPIGNKAIVQRACELLTARPAQTEQQPDDHIEDMRAMVEPAPAQDEPYTFCAYCGGNDEYPQDHCMDCTRPLTQPERSELVEALEQSADNGKWRYYTCIISRDVAKDAQGDKP